MSNTYAVSVAWARHSDDTTEKFHRGHDVAYGSGTTIPASSGTDFGGDAERVNPEEQLIGALSSCHMLTFLAIAAKKRLVVEGYTDSADGVLGKNAAGRMAVTTVTLRPKVVFGGEKQPMADEVKALHESAHRNCFIANSVATDVHVEPVV